jgi:outer membrane cobalamin receptor
MKQLFVLVGFVITLFSSAQNVVSGIVTDKSQQPITGANVYLEGTYDGASSDEEGRFEFTTSEAGMHKLIISYMSYETKVINKEVESLKDLKVVLRDDVNNLDAVVISAGTFEANDNSKVSVLKPLDVVTTASAVGDFVGALQTLPGTSNVAEDGRLFVRGGSAEETQIFIDGIRVFTPFTPTTNNIPTRGRYSPFLFDGITFSTGGYSAEYGQALSSVLLLNTINEPDQDKTDIGIMSVGGSIGNTQKWESNSLSVNVNYINLAPYLELFEDRNDWHKPFEGAQGEAVFRQKLNNGLLKAYAAFDVTGFELTQEDINFEEGVRYQLNNHNFYGNLSYKGVLSNSWSMDTGLSYTYARNNVGLEALAIKSTENSVHAKLKLRKRFSNRFKLSFGAEQFVTNFEENAKGEVFSESYGFDNPISAAFTESDLLFSKNLALKVGLRAEYSNIFKDFSWSPRAALAYKLHKHGQASLAYGDFYQNPGENILKFEQDLRPQHTRHFIFNYQYANDGKILRAELYRKDYRNLVKTNTDFPGLDTNFSSNGFAYAQGLDVFWRDNTSIKNLDYWVSYSYLDTERDHLNYDRAVQPEFATTHNLSIVGKYWIDSLKSQLGLAYNYSSGRPYTDPNLGGFLTERTKSFNSLSFNWAYLISQQKILYFSVNNVLGFKNVFGYQYANNPSENGSFSRRALRPANDQFFFVGFFWTISERGTDNQLNNL